MAALILAGGQATRLGADCKGEYDDGLPSHTPLYEVFAERIVRLKSLAAAAAGTPLETVSLPLYIMTSDATDEETRRFFTANAFFGLPEADVQFFKQAMMPCFSRDGKMLLEKPNKLAVAPGGNGGIFTALAAGGILGDMTKRGVRGLHVSPVDNIACRIADPVFIALCADRGAHVGSKVVKKAHPRENVGLLALHQGRLTAVEYSELDTATAEAVDPNTGGLRYDSGNACIHYFSLPFLQAAAGTSAGPAPLPHSIQGTDRAQLRMVDERLPSTWGLPPLAFHPAFKYIPRLDVRTGLTLQKAELEALGPEQGMAVKLEALAFDTFPFIPLRTTLVMEVDRSEEFAPIKNAPGATTDTPEIARQLMSSLHRRWLLQAGATIEGADDARVEVHPLVSYAGEGLGSLAGKALHAPLLVAPALLPRVEAADGPVSMDGDGTAELQRSFMHTYTVSPLVSVVMIRPRA